MQARIGSTGGGGSGQPVQIRIFGNDLDPLDAAGRSAAQRRWPAGRS